MNKPESLDADVKTRVEPSVKAAIELLAEKRHLKAADVVREALREYIAKHQALEKQPELLVETHA